MNRCIHCGQPVAVATVTGNVTWLVHAGFYANRHCYNVDGHAQWSVAELWPAPTVPPALIGAPGTQQRRVAVPFEPLFVVTVQGRTIVDCFFEWDDTLGETATYEVSAITPDRLDALETTVELDAHDRSECPEARVACGILDDLLAESSAVIRAILVGRTFPPES